MQTLTLASPDGPRLGARLFRPTPGQRVKAAVLIGGAMGVRQDYYQPFAQWLASQGYAVLSFDYRGMGDSRAGSLRGFDADLFSWARDTDTAIDALMQAAPQVPLRLQPGCPSVCPRQAHSHSGSPPASRSPPCSTQPCDCVPTHPPRRSQW